MPTEEESAYCPYCQRPVLGRREGVPSVLYAILTIFSCGVFGLVWALHYYIGRGDFACPTCGGKVTVTR